MKKMLLIINPAAGTKKAKRYLADIVDIFNRADFAVQIHVTCARGDAQTTVARLADEVDLVVCCGGDGTFNETVSGLLKAGSRTPVGYIPAGSTNDFANSLKLVTNCLKAASAITDGTACQYDVGRFEDRYFTYVASFGAFTKASYSTSQNAKNALGHIAYLMEGMQEMTMIKSIHLRLELDGEMVEDDYLFGAVCNSTSLGGLVTIDPKQVDMSDGLFEVVLIRKPREVSEITECLQAVQKHQYNCRMLTFRKVRQVRVYADGPMAWSLDGEQADTDGQVQIDNLQCAVTLIK